ncbi:MAG: hypothetical protein ACOCXT_05165 [Candidatus Dojkabacteria bacterium]
MPDIEQNIYYSVLEDIQGIFRKIIGIQAPFASLSEFTEQFADEIPYPVQETSQDNGEIVYRNRYYKNSITLSPRMKPENYERVFEGTTDISSIEDLLLLADRCNVNFSETFIPGHEIYQSSRVFSSAHVFRSQEIHNCHNISFSSHITNSYRVSASHNARNAEYCMRIIDSSDCSYSFNITNSLGIKSSFFLRDCKNCKHCMFSFNLTDSTFCIGNTPYTSNEYYRVRNILFENFNAIFAKWTNKN